jgi:hypothetical protein
MSDILQIIAPLRAEIKKLNSVQGKSLETLHDTINSLSETANDLEDLWVGHWGNTNYNHYHNPKNYNEGIQVNTDYFYNLISKKHNVNIDNFERDVSNHLEPYKKFQQHLITELSVIRDNENFNNENELLKSIENFKWGVEPSDYITLRRPNQIPIYNMRALARGLETPPHIAVSGYLISLTTKTFSVRNFEELVSRILRQVELKLTTNSIPDNYGYTDKILNDKFENFHSFCTQLKNRHSNRQTIEIKDEYDVQDLLHCILKLHFKDVREEEYTPSYGGSSSRMDFLLKNENIVIEVKKTRERLSDKEIGEQLILDVAHYKNHPNCNILKCFVYDPENRVKNPRGLENDLKKLSDDNLSVELFIRP